MGDSDKRKPNNAPENPTSKSNASVRPLNNHDDNAAIQTGRPPFGDPPNGGPPPFGNPLTGGPPPGYSGPPPGFDDNSGALNLPGFFVEFGKLMHRDCFDNLAMWFLDIRNFRSVNPKYGFIQGNLTLHTVVDGIRKLICHDLPVARLGGDRFIFMSEGLTFEEAKEHFEELCTYVNNSLAESNIDHNLPLSAGIYYLREEDFEVGDYRKALDYASIAHRNARATRQSSILQFTDEDLERDMRRIAIEQSIDSALEEGQIEVWYQPQVDYTYGEIIGAEALARWKHPEMGWISPAEFIPVLENCGKVHALDLYVWEEACRSAGKWHNVSDGKPVPISVNVSRTEMFKPGLLEHFLELQRKYDIPEGGLRLEVTESAFVEEADRLYRIIEAMREHDLLVEMDDFGSGLSSLNMLKDVPVDVVKLDMGFLRKTMNGERGGVVLSSVIRMLQGLDTPIIAEGVETLEQAEMLKNMGCHLMQGYHFSRPMPLDDFESFMSSSKTVEKSDKRSRINSHLEDLMHFDSASSYLFNNAIGGLILFFIEGSVTESIIVNDKFYEECGLLRSDFGNRKINPIEEIEPDSRATLWRATAEAREKGCAFARAQVKLTGRWIDCALRFITDSARGEVYSLNILKSGEDIGDDAFRMQASHEIGWNYELLNKIIPSGFVKCAIDDALTFDYVSPEFLAASGLSVDDFNRRFHNSFLEIVVVEDRPKVYDVVLASLDNHGLVECNFDMYYGFYGLRSVQMTARVDEDPDGNQYLYALIMKGNGKGKNKIVDDVKRTQSDRRTIQFEYYMKEDRLVIHSPNSGGAPRKIEINNWLANLEYDSERIAPSSAARVLAIMRDLQSSPISGFTDIKCNLRSMDSLRWYHINYACDADEYGMTTVVHGYAQDADDQMGSAKWWRQQAERDYLTGLLNRNAVEQAVNVSVRAQGGGMLFMIDLDDFKQVNDKYGHITGDALLRDVAVVLESHFRGSDVLGRYGGDEFIAFVPLVMDDAESMADKRASDIVKSISEIVVRDNVTAACSVGVAITRDRNATFHDLLRAADGAMYRCKQAGKGMCSVFVMDSESETAR